jgi:TetR/AcrR family transcriptional repressor of nem operon
MVFNYFVAFVLESRFDVAMARLKAFDEDCALDAAVDCFWLRGYEATSVRDLAEAMGIGSASLYNAYGDKRALFSRSLERYAERSMRDRIARMEADRRPKEAIGAFIAEIVDRSLKDPDRKGCLLVNSALDVAPHDAEIGRVVAGYLGEIRSFFRRNIEAARAARQVPDHLDAEEVSGHLLGVLLGIRVLARTGAKRKLLEAVARPALELLEDRR